MWSRRGEVTFPDTRVRGYRYLGHKLRPPNGVEGRHSVQVVRYHTRGPRYPPTRAQASRGFGQAETFDWLSMAISYEPCLLVNQVRPILAQDPAKLTIRPENNYLFSHFFLLALFSEKSAVFRNKSRYFVISLPLG